MKNIKKILAFILIIICTISFPINVFSDDDTGGGNGSYSKAIVIIPGILGSTLADSTGTVWVEINASLLRLNRMKLNENGEPLYSLFSVHNNYGAKDTYKILYDELKASYGNRFDVVFFDYDFRLSNNESADRLENELSAYTEVVLVAHSMGGLVAAKYLANSSANRNKTTTLITVGTPFVGSAKCTNVMETGEMMTLNIAGIDTYVLEDIIKEVSKNSYAAYQLLPTTKYYNITGEYPLAINGTNYSTTSMSKLQNTAWGKKNDGSVKPMFSGATSFHSALFSGSTHITDFTDVRVHTIAGRGVDTITKVSMNSNYEITALTYSNAGDGTVLQKSAGYGNPNYSFTNREHVALVKDDDVIARIKSLISLETGISAATVSEEQSALLNNSNVEMDSCNITVNERGWINGTDNKRINIYTDNQSVLLMDGVNTIEVNEGVFTEDGTRIGSVWKLGSTGRKMYAMYDGNYEISGMGIIKVEYMDDGYFEKIIEYDSEQENIFMNITNFETKSVSCERDNVLIQLDMHYIYSDAQLMELNEN